MRTISIVPKSGRIVDDDGNVYNLVDLLNQGGALPVSDVNYDITKYMPSSGNVIGEDGKAYSLVKLLQSIVAGEGSIEDGAVTTEKIADKAVTQDKLADDLVTFIQDRKIEFLTGQHNANNLNEPGLYINVGGYGLTHAPRDNYGWMLISSRGPSNGHHRGAQLYVDHDGIDWRGLDGSTYTAWETCIVKNKLADVEPIEDTSTATVEDLANAYNALLTALKG